MALRQGGFSRCFSSCVARNGLKLAQLPTRSIQFVSGKDGGKFLQGLISNDIRLLEQNSPIKNNLGTKDDLLFAGLFGSDGRMHQDLLISKLAQDGEAPPIFLVEHPAESSEELLALFKKHKLRAKVSFKPPENPPPADGWKVYAIWDDSNTNPREAAQTINDLGALSDSRHPALGWRLYTNNAPQLGSSIESVRLEEYAVHRAQLAIPENTNDFPPVPLEGNLDLMNGISYKKGCYVGQELTARTHHTGIVAKRIVNVTATWEGKGDPGLPPEAKTSLVPFPIPKRPRPVGRIGNLVKVENKGDAVYTGTASIKLDELDQRGQGVFTIRKEKGESENSQEGLWVVRALLPDWIKSKLEALAQEKAARSRRMDEEQL